jgi:N-acetylglucosaminyl-diphospho-decaprenol L-rhamnosyltransferase
VGDIGIVIVTYNSAAVIAPCLEAALATRAEVVVVDNASPDGTVREAARHGVRLIANSENRGFAAAVNQGFAVLKSPYVLVLNPDVVIAGSLDPLRQACDRPRAAGAGGLLLGADRRPQQGFMYRKLPTPPALAFEVLGINRVWPRNPVNRRYRELDADVQTPKPVEQPAGAFLMLRRQVWNELGGFDESYYPLWFEDVDFCRRAINSGYSLFYEPAAVGIHTGAHSIAQLPIVLKRFYWYRSLLSYSAKHFSVIAFRLMCVAVMAGSLLRAAAESLRGRTFEPARVYGDVVRFAGRCLLFGWTEETIQPGPRFEG